MSTDNLTVDEFALMWLEEVSTRAKPQTLARYRAEYRLHVAPGLGALRLVDVTRGDVKRLVVEKIRDGVKGGMLVRVLSMLFSSAYDEGRIAKHPAQRLRRLFPRASGGTTGEVKAMSSDELARFLQAMKGEPIYEKLFRTMALTGLRHGEARALQVRDVRTKKLRIEVERTFAGGNDLSWSPKTGRSRRVEIPKALARELEPLLRWRKPEEWVFHRRGKALRDCTARQAFRRGLCRAQLPEHFTPHSLRHTYASILIQQGVRAEYIQRQLGHASIQITVDIYGKWLELSNADELDRFMGSVSTPPEGERRLKAPASLIPFYRASGVKITRTSCSSTDEEGNPDPDPRGADVTRVAIDLFSGSGQATAAFRKAADWRVITLDLDLARRPDILADVGWLPLKGSVDFLWASPPCTEFSDARPGASNRRPSLELVCATLAAVRDLRPRFWILENVRGAIPFLGIPVQKIGPFCLWGYFPPIRISVELHSYRKDTKRVRSAAARATVPRALSDAVFQAVTRYWDFPRLLDLRELRRHRHVRQPAAPPGLFEAPR